MYSQHCKFRNTFGLLPFYLVLFLKQTLAFGDLRELRVLVYFEILPRVANLERSCERSDCSFAGYWSHLLVFSSSSGHPRDALSACHSLEGTESIPTVQLHLWPGLMTQWVLTRSTDQRRPRREGRMLTCSAVQRGSCTCAHVLYL